MTTNRSAAKEWPKDEDENFGYVMRRYRDDTAELLISIVRLSEELEALTRDNKATRTKTLANLTTIQKAALLGITNLLKAGAPVDPASISASNILIHSGRRD